MGLSIDALAESAVVLPPAGTVGSDLATGVAAGWVAERVHGICGDSRGLGVRRGAAPRQLSWPGVGRPPAGTWAEGGKNASCVGHVAGRTVGRERPLLAGVGNCHLQVWTAERGKGQRWGSRLMGTWMGARNQDNV